MRRSLVIASVASAIVAASAPAAAAPTVYLRVVAVSSSARLTYSGAPVVELEHTSGTVDVTTRKAKGRAPARNGSLSARGGRITVKLTVKDAERATIGRRASASTPYVEQRCVTLATRTAAGGVVLKRLSGGRIEVRWAFPHANAVTCPGPSGVGKSLAAELVRVYPASRFAARRSSLSLAGSSVFERGPYSGTYRWRASLTLARA